MFLRHSLPALVLLSCLPAAHAQQQVEAFVDTKTFQTPEGRGQVDINLGIVGASVTHAPNARGFEQARVEALTLVQRDGNIVAYRKTEVKGPEHLDSLRSDFLHQEQFVLEPGDYALEIELRDLNANTNDSTVTRFKGPLAIPGPGLGASFSEVVLADAITPAGEEDASSRFGQRVIPAVSTYYPAERNALQFYAELYNSDTVFGKDSLFLLAYQIEGFESKVIAGAYRKQSRVRAAAVVPAMARFDITNLPSGNYVLALEARDRNGQLMARREQFFQRNNPIAYDLSQLETMNMGATFVDAFADRDSLAEHVRSLRPIATDLERKIIDDRAKDRDLDLMKRFFYSFWFNRNSYDPAGAWERYRREVIKVNQIYGCRIKRGYDTDRGYVHLKYGPPNTIMDQPHDEAGYPYQIWHYYRVGKYSNKRFVFYLPDRVTSCYELLHSEVPGEVNNPNWNQMLHATNTPMNNVQDNSVPLGHGQEVQDFYNFPH